MIKLGKKGQSIMEYAVLISLVIAAITGMQLYVKRGLQQRIKDASDNLPGYVQTKSAITSNIFGTNTQYEPYYKGDSAISSTTTSGTEKYIALDDKGMRELKCRTRTITGDSAITSYENAD